MAVVYNDNFVEVDYREERNEFEIRIFNSDYSDYEEVVFSKEQTEEFVKAFSDKLAKIK